MEKKTKQNKKLRGHLGYFADTSSTSNWLLVFSTITAFDMNFSITDINET